MASTAANRAYAEALPAASGATAATTNRENAPSGLTMSGREEPSTA